MILCLYERSIGASLFLVFVFGCFGEAFLSFLRVCDGATIMFTGDPLWFLSQPPSPN
ncbi:hypothetical protein Hanom_Chr04g00357721 [Helianthus anomalus]